MLRTTAVLSLGDLIVHELRYRIAFGSDAPHALATSGHGYLGTMTPVVAILAMLGIASVVQRMAEADGPVTLRRGRIWLALASGLLAVFTLQELLEALLTAQRPDAVAGVVGSGGWLAVPLSMAVAGVALVFVRVAGSRPLRGVAVRLVVLRVDGVDEPSSPSATAPLRPPFRRHRTGRAPPIPA